MTVSVILRQDKADGQLEPVRGPKQEQTWSDHRKAEAEQSRMQFRDDGGRYCVYTGVFASWNQAMRFCQYLNQGLSINKAMRLLRENP